MKMPPIIAISQSARSAVKPNPAGAIRGGLLTLSARERARTAGIRVPTVFQTERVPSAVTPVHTAIPKKYIRMRMYLPDITSTVTLQAVIPAAKP